MPTKPIVSVEWAIAAGALKTVPSTDQKNRGWDTSDGTVTGTAPEPIMQNQNGWQNNAYQWINWLDVITTKSNSVREIAAITFAFATTDVNIADDEITEVGHGMLTGDKFQGTSTGTLPAGLSLATDYWAIYVTDDIIKPAATLADAVAGTPVDITDVGTGTHTFTSENEWAMLDDDGFDKYIFTTGSNNHTLIFATLSANFGRTGLVRKGDSGSGHVTMDGEGAETINGQTTIKITSQYEQSKFDAGSAEWFADYQSDIVLLDGGFNGGELNVKVVRNGNVVSITGKGIATHGSAANVTSNAAIIPAWATPITTTTYNSYYIDSTLSAVADVSIAGAFRVDYGAARLNTIAPVNISYSII